MNITIKYATLDGFRKTGKFKTLAGARKYARAKVGDNPEIGSSYAVSDDGVGKITVEGDATLADLFSDPAPEKISF